jgi:hypothetical protein
LMGSLAPDVFGSVLLPDGLHYFVQPFADKLGYASPDEYGHAWLIWTFSRFLDFGGLLEVDLGANHESIHIVLRDNVIYDFKAENAAELSTWFEKIKSVKPEGFSLVRALAVAAAK